MLYGSISANLTMEAETIRLRTERSRAGIVAAAVAKNEQARRHGRNKNYETAGRPA